MRRITDKLWSWASIVDEQTVTQARQISEMPFVLPHMAQMPDAHFGKGAPVGSVIPTVGAIMPAAVGVDIGCGMIARRTQFTLHDIREHERDEDLGLLRLAIERAIPSSVARYNTHLTTRALRKVRELEGTPGAQQAYDIAQNWPYQLGSLGSGNHFIEVTADEQGRVWLFLHSGSRGVGNKLAMHHIRKAIEYTTPGYGKPAHYKLINQDHAFLEQGTEEFSNYIRDLRWAQKFAWLNRLEMMERLTYEFGAWIGAPVHVTETVNCHHNYTEQVIDIINGDTRTWLSRKGAINAGHGVMGLIPGSMGTPSYVVEGKGNPDSFNSAPHGAGRLHSRGSAKRTFTMDELEASMKGIEWMHDKAFLDEAPMAYKPIDQIIEDSADLIEVKHRLFPIVNVKGL